MQDRFEEAKNIIFRLHSTETTHLRTKSMTRSGSRRPLTRSWRHLGQVFEGKAVVSNNQLASVSCPCFMASYRCRVADTCFYCFLGQSTAILVIINYGPTFYAALGFDVRQTLFLTAGWVSVCIPFGLIGAFLSDIIGRRPIMLIGIGGCCICLIIEAAAVRYFETNLTRKDFGALGVTALFCFNAVYQLGVDVGGNVFYSKVFPIHIRSKGVALAKLVLALADLVYLQVTPYAFANIGWRFFLVSSTNLS